MCVKGSNIKVFRLKCRFRQWWEKNNITTFCALPLPNHGILWSKRSFSFFDWLETAISHRTINEKALQVLRIALTSCNCW